nr:hypothetical protein [Tanacetum cinerariifolium]
MKHVWDIIISKQTLWEEHGPISNFIPDREIYNARFNKGACTADMIQDGKWIWRDDWWSKFPILEQIKVLALNNENDFVRWLNKDGVPTPFSIKGVWINMRYDYPNVDWYKVVWFSQCTPRHAIIMWLAIQDRLQTQDKMAKWCNDRLACPLYEMCFDSVTYLFFECCYANKVWNDVKDKICVEEDYHQWQDIILQL